MKLNSVVEKKRRIHERQPIARPPVKAAPEALPDAQGWRIYPATLTAYPHVKFVARAAFPGFKKPVERRFRDHESAKAWAGQENAKLAELEPNRAEPLLSSRELMGRLNLSPDMLFGLRQRGLPCVKITCHDYRYYWSEVKAFLDAPREQVQVAPKPFIVERWKMGGYRFRVRGTGEWAHEKKGFTSQSKAIQYAATRNRAVGLRANAPVPRRTSWQEEDAPLCQVSPLNLKSRPDLRYRAYVYFEGQKHAKEWHFRTEQEALHFANRKNLELARQQAAREAEHAPAPDKAPAIQWTPAQMEGVDSGARDNPVKGPPFRIHATTQKNYSFVVTGPKLAGTKTRPRSFFKTEREAKTYAHMRNTEAQMQGMDSVTFPAWLRISAQRCHQLLSQRGKTIEDATKHFLDYIERTEKSMALGELVKACLAAKKNAGFTKGWLYLLKRGGERFRDAMGADTYASEITTERLNEYIATTKGTPSTRNSLRAVLWAIFTYAERTGHVQRNPVVGTIKETVVRPPVGIFTPTQMHAIMEAAPAQWIPFLAIGAFAGMRCAEIKRLDWSEVDLTDGYIEVTAEKAKTRTRRLIKILPALEAFLSPYVKASGNVCPCKGFIPTTHIPDTLKRAGIDRWPKNALRHSYASYHLAHFRNAGMLAAEMGHTNPNMTYDHYRQVVKSAEAARWWEIRPSPESAAAKIVTMRPEEKAAATA